MAAFFFTALGIMCVLYNGYKCDPGVGEWHQMFKHECGSDQ